MRVTSAIMMDSGRPIYIPPEGPPQGLHLDSSIYVSMGEANIFKMLEDFYAELERSTIRSMFPENMAEASKKSGAFFVFILGGPPLYQQQFGPPMMRRRHLPFPITEEARQVWLSCFKTILADAERKYQFPRAHMPSFIHFLDQFSRWMVNSK